MIKKIFKITSILVFVGFSFFYTEKVTKIARNKDPIMVKINEKKDNMVVSLIEPIIVNDEYIPGINGCEIDVEKSYNKMKKVGEFKEELLVMQETNINDKLKDKYIISGNKINKNVSINFIVRNDVDNELLSYLSDKKIKTNFFIDGDYLENNIVTVKFLAESNNIYYLGENGSYDDKYMLYVNNLISMNSNNESKYCLLNKKNDEMLKLCSEYDMDVIKNDYINNNILNNVKEKLTNGAIITIDSNDIEQIKISINYILSKGYNIVTLDKLLNENNTCN